MKVTKTELEGVLILEPELHGDERGYFLETWHREDYAARGIDCDFVQDNESKSVFGVIRGLHWQAAPYTQAKLVRVVSGSVLDVVVDVRRDSPTFAQYVSVELTDKNHRQLFVPRGFAHGFVVTSKEAIFAYKCDNVYHPRSERGLNPYDPTLRIDWKVLPQLQILSDKDRRHPFLENIKPWTPEA